MLYTGNLIPPLPFLPQGNMGLLKIINIHWNLVTIISMIDYFKFKLRQRFSNQIKRTKFIWPFDVGLSINPPLKLFYGKLKFGRECWILAMSVTILAIFESLDDPGLHKSSPNAWWIFGLKWKAKFFILNYSVYFWVTFYFNIWSLWQ